MNPEQPAVEQKTRHSFFAASHPFTIRRRPSYNSVIIMNGIVVFFCDGWIPVSFIWLLL